MRSLRARMFVTTAIVLAAATLAAGLLSRRATLIEERQIVGPRHPPSLEGVEVDAQRAYAEQGADGLRRMLTAAASARGVRFIAVDRRKAPIAASSPDLEQASVRAADESGRLSLVVGGAETRSALEMRGIPTFGLKSAEGEEVARVFVLPDSGDGPLPSLAPWFAPWIRITAGTAAVALIVAFVVGGRILRPVGDLTRAARRMREGDLDVRVETAGDDEIARLARAFNDLAERLAQNERSRRQMVSDVAHELRSPVTNLRCALEAIQDGLVIPDRAQIDALHSDALLLQRLIGDLQDLALAESGELSLQRGVVDVGSIARRIAAADTAGPRVAVTIAADADTVAGDAGRIEQMLRNLVNNARRHTPAGGAIAIRTRRDGDAVIIDVTDTGEGIDATHLGRIFERFYRVDGSRDRATGGAGLGLAIVRRLAEAQGGSVTAASEGPGRGATFSIRMGAAGGIESRT